VGDIQFTQIPISAIEMKLRKKRIAEEGKLGEYDTE